jgi:hypothetical protein
LKSYLKVSTSDLKGVFDRFMLFWPDQHQNILNSMAQEKNKVKHALHKAYFNIIQSLVYDRALHLILIQCAKLHKAKEENTHLRPCICTIKQSMGLPCFHTIHQRFLRGGYILLEDIHPFWWYKRLERGTSFAISVQNYRLVLNPAVVRGKGRPKGSKNKAKNHGVTSTRRDPSQFEYVPSSTALAALGSSSTQPTESRAVQSLLAQELAQEEQEEDEEYRRFQASMRR